MTYLISVFSVYTKLETVSNEEGGNVLPFFESKYFDEKQEVGSKIVMLTCLVT